MNVKVLRRDLFHLWDAACEEFQGESASGEPRSSKLPESVRADFSAWSGATKDLLMALGMYWDSERELYAFRSLEEK